MKPGGLPLSLSLSRQHGRHCDGQHGRHEAGPQHGKGRWWWVGEGVFSFFEGEESPSVHPRVFSRLFLAQATGTSASLPSVSLSTKRGVLSCVVRAVCLGQNDSAKNPHAVPTPRCPLLQCWGGAAYGRVGAG